MKTRYKLISLILSVSIFTGCVDMDTFPEGDIITDDQRGEVVADDASKAEAGVTSIFSQFSTYMSVTGTRHNDIGYPAIMLFMDTNGYDCISMDNGYNWAGSELTYDDRSIISNESRIVWHTLYQLVYTANKVVDSIEPETQDPVFQFYLGQALAARAFDYWVLAQLYQFNYADHKSSPCVPLVTEKNFKTVHVDGAKRSTVEEVYTQIMTDINRAIELLTSAQEAGEKRRDKRYIDLSVAYGLRARVNLTMEKWADAASDATAAIANSNSVPYSIQAVSVPTMYDSNDASWMWGIVVAETDRVVTSGIVNWPSHMGTLNYGYCNYSKGRQINKALWNSIPASDVRKGWWLDEKSESKNLNDAYKRVITRYSYPAYTNVKFAPYKEVALNSVNANDIPLMRIEEMYLIKAEGEAMSGNVAQAKTTLEGLIKTYRDPDYSTAISAAAAMQEEIYRQRRIEFWGEGLSWFDIMRLKKPVDRRGAGYPSAATIYNIPAGSDILLWRLPETEISANPLLTAADNNTPADKPSPVNDN